MALSIPVLFGTETGNAEFCSENLVAALEGEGFDAELIDMMDFNPSDISTKRVVLIVTSTYGNGDPPSNAEEFLRYLQNEKPALPHLNFAVCGLGDSSFTHFAQCGKDFEKALLDCSAVPMFDRVDCDEDYDVAFDRFQASALAHLSDNRAALEAAPVPNATQEVPSAAAESGEAKEDVVSRDRPFMARLAGKRLLSKPGSAKETMHYDVDIAGSGLSFRVGDCFGVHPVNSQRVISEALSAAGLEGSAPVTWRGSETSLAEALKGACLLQVTLDLVKTLAGLAGGQSPAAQALSQGDAAVSAFIRDHQVIDALRAHRTDALSAQALVAALRRLQPRLYSVASSPTRNSERVGFTIETLRYTHQGRAVEGVASCWLADQVAEGGAVPLYVVKNDAFLFPSDETPVIMVGPGTGIAPFRAYLEEVEAARIQNRTWLFFGHQHASKDFLYEDEIKRWQLQRTLDRVSFAWSRDQEHKVYVQHRIAEAGDELWRWIEQGACIYVCGDAQGMAPAVAEAFKAVATRYGAQADGEAWLAQMVAQGRYKTDVY